ncbi:HgcAB-associated protein HgcC [[Eubacterium] cellulosolvens]
MAKKKDQTSCCGLKGGMSCCNVEGFVNVDERGQMVLPKDIRGKANISAGDKLVIVTCQIDGQIKVISLIRSGDFEEMVKDFMGPMMGEIFQSDNRSR